MAMDTKDKKMVAIKIEENKKNEKLNNEAKIIKFLTSEEKKKLGIPNMHWVGADNILVQYTFMVMDLLGPSLEDLFQMCDRSFSMKTVLMIAEGALNIIEFLHQ